MLYRNGKITFKSAVEKMGKITFKIRTTAGRNSVSPPGLMITAAAGPAGCPGGYWGRAGGPGGQANTDIF